MASLEYTAYERTQGAALEGVEAKCQHLTQDGSFTDDTVPSDVSVSQTLTESYYRVAAELAAAGYAVTQTDTEVLGFLQRLNILDAALNIELSVPIVGPGEPNERYRALQMERDAMFALLKTQALTVLGAEKGSSYSDLFAQTGVIRDDKRDVDSDSDLVPKRFRRGFMQSGDVSAPTAATSNSEDD